MSAENGADAARTQSISFEQLDEIIIVPDSYPADLGKAEKESSQYLADRKHLGKVHPKKRNKVEARSSGKESHHTGLTDDSMDGNPLYGTTLE